MKSRRPAKSRTFFYPRASRPEREMRRAVIATALAACVLVLLIVTNFRGCNRHVGPEPYYEGFREGQPRLVKPPKVNGWGLDGSPLR